MIALLFFVLVGTAMAGDFGVGLVQHEYKNCTEISPLGLVCGIIDVDPKNEWVAVKISVNNHFVFDKDFKYGRVCATEIELFKLLEHVPALERYKSLFEEIIKIWGEIPAEMFDVCLVLEEAMWRQHLFHACAKLDLKVVCWQGSCVHEGVHELGCFAI